MKQTIAPNASPFWPIAALLTLMSTVILWRSPDVDGVRELIRWTARTSLVFFLMAYTAQAWFSRWPGDGTRWWRQHRRQWGWLLVLSHTIHAGAIVALGVMDPVLFERVTPLANRISGGLGYVWLWAMGATSFDRTAAWLGRTWWSRLHTWGSHYLWFSFLVANGKRIPHDPVYLFPVLLLLAALVWREWSRRAERTIFARS